MLNIYIGKSSLPKDKKFVFDIGNTITALDISRDVISRDIVKEIDGGTVIDSRHFSDKWQSKLYSDCLSTTAQILIAANQVPNIIFNADEMGTNGLYYLDSMEEGSLYFSDSANFPLEIATPISINGNVCNSTSDVFDIIAEVSWYEN